MHVVAVIVTYFPSHERLKSQLDVLVKQAQHVVIIDNTPTLWDKSGLNYSVDIVSWLAFQINLGLATGLNMGIAKAKQLGASHVLLMDQDSVPHAEMIQHLKKAFISATSLDNLAAVGPNFIDDRGEKFTPFWTVGFPKNRASQSQKKSPYVETDFLITSGSLVCMQALTKIGVMNESLFIDNVDLEWCLRTRAEGWRLLGVPHAYLSHQLGDSHMRAPWFAQILGKQFIVQHNATRLYYIMRNRILLYKMPHVPMTWIAQDLLRLPWKFTISILASSEKIAVTNAMLLGIWHGLVNIDGKKPNRSTQDA